MTNKKTLADYAFTAEIPQPARGFLKGLNYKPILFLFLLPNTKQ